MEERREFYRKKLPRFQIALRRGTENGFSEPRRVKVIDISGGGVGVESEYRFNVGDVVFGEMKLEGKPVRFLGEVVRNQGKIYGIKFTAIREDERKILVRYTIVPEKPKEE